MTRSMTSLVAATAAIAAAFHSMSAFSAPMPPETAAPPVEAFFGEPALLQPVLSPSGDAVAILARNTAGHRQLAIVDTADTTKVTIAFAFQGADAGDVQWVNDTRLIVQQDMENEAAYDRVAGDLYAVDRDGSNVRHVLSADSAYRFVRSLRDGTDDVVLMRMGYSSRSVPSAIDLIEPESGTAVRISTRRERGSEHQLGNYSIPKYVFDWMIDDQGKVLGGVSSHGGDSHVYAPSAHDDYTDLRHFRTFGDDKARFHFLEVGADGRAYATAYDEKAGADSLYRLDMATGLPEAEPVVRTRGFDFVGSLVNDARKHQVVGVHYLTDAGGTVWFDPDLAKAQAKVDVLLPGRVNRLEPASCGCSTHMLLVSSSDQQPEEYFLYDRATGNFTRIGPSRPGISAAAMARTDFYRIKARDGHEIPVYVTTPRGKGPFPAVVLVHGGPFVRGWDWSWDDESQFFASRGYVVVKPEYRGSEGYGNELLVSGFRQWGLAMQDDIADATRWAAAQGVADSSRTCIVGSSYGGYAALMGLVRDGDLYRCGVAASAVTDIGLMKDLWLTDMGTDWKTYGMPLMVADPERDAAQIAATSPIRQAAHIRRPLLLVHGGSDFRVPVEHGTRMRDALQAQKARVTWVEYADEGHGLSKPENRYDYYRRVEAFLASNLAPDASAPKP